MCTPFMRFWFYIFVAAAGSGFKFFEGGAVCVEEHVISFLF
jgi:hypothetical protein